MQKKDITKYQGLTFDFGYQGIANLETEVDTFIGYGRLSRQAINFTPLDALREERLEAQRRARESMNPVEFFLAYMPVY